MKRIIRIVMLWMLCMTWNLPQPLAAQSAKEKLMAQLQAIIDRMEAADRKGNYADLLKEATEFEQALKYRSELLLFIPNESQQAEYERATVLDEMSHTPLLDQYKRLIYLIQYRARKAMGDKESARSLISAKLVGSGYLKSCTEAYSILLDINGYKPSYRLRHRMMAYWHLTQALKQTDNRIMDPITQRLETLVKVVDYSPNAIKLVHQELCASFRTVTAEEVDQIFQTFRFDLEWGDKVAPIAEVLHQLGFARGTFALALRLYQQGKFAEALPLFEQTHRKGYDRGTMAYALTLWNLDENSTQRHKQIYELLSPLTENSYFKTLGALPWADLLEKGICMEADTIQALESYMSAYEWGLTAKIKEKAYQRHRLLFDRFESSGVEFVTADGENDYAQQANYYAELNDSLNMLKALNKGIDEGNVECMVILGEQYHKGQVLKRNDKLAATYTQRALDKNPNHLIALGNMAYMLTNGYGLMPDLDRAWALVKRGIGLQPEDEYLKRVQDIVSKAMTSHELRNLGYGYLRKRNLSYEKAFYYYNRAALKGDVAAMYWLAVYYLKGLGGNEPNPKQAIELLRQALPYPPAKELLNKLENNTSPQ